MYNKILVPLDGSPYAECVLDHVKALASGCQAKEVVILYVVEPINPGNYEVPLTLLEDVKERAVAFAKEYVADIAARFSSEEFSVSTVVLEGRAADAILSYANENQIDLIIMSTHGRSGISRFFMGSVTDRVTRHSIVPVLMITPPQCRTSQVSS